MLVRMILATHVPSLQGRIRRLLPERDLIIHPVRDRDELWQQATQESYDLLLVSRALLPKPAGDIVAAVRSLPESPEVVVLTPREDEEDRAQLLAVGCLAVLSTRLSNSMLREAFETILSRRHDEAQGKLAAYRAPRRESLSHFVSASPAMQAFMRIVRRVVHSDASLLLLGETGVGKEWLARAIHHESARANGPFIAVNCGALPESLLESELFGHEEGAFTGATRARRGIFELAHRGTVFLDEIGEMPLHLQVKLLRVVQSREVQRLGAETSIPFNLRIMAATNRELEAEVATGGFRKDLYYRLGVVTLAVPPLRERREDVPALVENTIRHFRGQFPQGADGIEPRALAALVEYPWPGNVRELINVIERVMLLSEGNRILFADLPESICRKFGAPPSLFPEGRTTEKWFETPYKQLRARCLDDFDRAYLTELLKLTGGRIGEAAERAGIDPRSIYDKMRRLGLRKETFKAEQRRS